MITIGSRISWRMKSEDASIARIGFVSQWRPNPERIEIVPSKLSAYGKWLNVDDISYVVIKRGS